MHHYTPLEDIPKIREELRATFRKGITRPLSWRRHQLLQLARMMQENAEALADALVADLGKPRIETHLAEICVVMNRALSCAEKLQDWTKPELVDVPDWQKPWKPTVYQASKGTALIISPWNYPLILTFQPVYGAISAGCCAVIKPSEISANTSALIAELVPKYLDQSAYRVVQGGVPEITKALELQWDHIYYTGNGRVARIIAAAAAKHLTPLTLELGGKSPVFVDGTFDLAIAAKRTLLGKISNAGQLCVSPDHVLILKDHLDDFIEGLKAAYKSFYPDGALEAVKSHLYGRIVTDAHFTRIKGLLGRTKGEIVLGGATDDSRGFEPTVVRGVEVGDALLEEEIFGPILSLVAVDSVDDAVDFINSSRTGHPLVIYAFTENEPTKQRLLESTTSGNLIFNDTFQQLAVDELPFGGVGDSGYGRQVMKYSYDNFTYLRSSVDISKDAEPHLEVRYPPYTKDKFAFFAKDLEVKIPPSSPA